MKAIRYISFIVLFILVASTLAVSSAAAEHSFTDVVSGSWYEEAVVYCFKNGYMSGKSETAFDPSGTLTRAMTATILSSMSGDDKDIYADRQTFDDVPKGKWYSTSVEWAYEKGVVSGYGNGIFNPNKAITREQLAVMLKAYADYLGIDTSAREENLDSLFVDSSAISSWSRESISWAVKCGLISGNDKSMLMPRNTATRAQAAVIIYQFSEKILGNGNLASGVSVSRAFGDHMTIQRNKPFSVWGWADESDEGKLVEVSFKGQKAYGKVENGEWKATFAVTFPESAEGSVITVRGRDTSFSFSDVLVGDVYYVMGQSNVYWPLGAMITEIQLGGNIKDVEGVDYDNSTNIRLFRNSHVFQAGKTGEDAWGTAKVYKDVDSQYAVWARPSDFDATKDYDVNTEFIGGRSFSAFGYLFAFYLSQNTDVPIAMIEIDASGYALTAFAPNELAEKWDSDIASPEGVYYMKLGTAENGNLTIFPLHSRMAYNQQLYPLINFSCAGLLWYQGESDYINTIYNYGKDVWTFSNELADLITYFRGHFGNGDFPVYFVEYPACFKVQNSNAYIDFGVVRSELCTIPQHLENSYVLSCSDCWSNKVWANNCHPFCKPAQARRLVSMVLANQYGAGDIEYKAGPLCDKVEYPDEYTAIVTFKYVGDGLDVVSEDESGDIYGVQVLTSPDNYTEWATAENVQIVGKDQIRIEFDQPIYGVRYNAITEYYFPVNVNLMNSERVPAAAFVDYKN